MKRKTLSFLVVAIFTVTAGMAAQVNAASQEVQKQNLRSVQAQANASQSIAVALPIKAKIEMKGGSIRDGQVLEIDEKGQKLWIKGAVDKKSLPLSQVEKIVFPNNVVVYSAKGGPIYRGPGAKATSIQAKWNGIPISAFEFKDAAQGQAVVKLGPPVVSGGQLRGILGVAKDRQFVVDEMQFDLQKNTMTISATPY